MIVIASVICSMGTLGFAHVATTLVTIEVVPFLILAVGVDNLFILIHAYQRLDISKYVSSSEAVADALGEVGPSILLTALSQAGCFAIGTLTDMPAVHTFALYATVAISFNFFLQITAFISFMTIDLVRFNVSFRLFLCFSIENFNRFIYRMHVTIYFAGCDTILMKMMGKYKVGFKRYSKLFSHQVYSKASKSHQKCVLYLHNIVDARSFSFPYRIYKAIILLTFTIMTCTSIYFIPNIEIGLDQQLSMSKSSHVYKYFEVIQFVNAHFSGFFLQN